MSLLVDPPAAYITQRRITVQEAMIALQETLKELARIGAAVDSADGATLPPPVAHEYRAMTMHAREADTALDRDDMPTARYHYTQGRECAARLAAYLRSVDDTTAAALEELDHATV